MPPMTKGASPLKLAMPPTLPARSTAALSSASLPPRSAVVTLASAPTSSAAAGRAVAKPESIVSANAPIENRRERDVFMESSRMSPDDELGRAGHGTAGASLTTDEEDEGALDRGAREVASGL